MQTEAFGIESFLIAVKEQGNMKAAGERIKGNNVHYCISMYHSDFSEGKIGECVYSRKRAHFLETRRITGKRDFLKNKAMYCKSSFLHLFKIWRQKKAQGTYL